MDSAAFPELLAVARSGAGSALGLKIFFSLLLVLVLLGGFSVFRSREKMLSHRGDLSDSYASGNLRMWMVLLVWIHAVVILIAMIYRV
ncbi:hypothetical protein BH20VER1_BH20VER1_19020 [soil metagenome]